MHGVHRIACHLADPALSLMKTNDAMVRNKVSVSMSIIRLLGSANNIVALLLLSHGKIKGCRIGDGICVSFMERVTRHLDDCTSP